MRRAPKGSATRAAVSGCHAAHELVVKWKKKGQGTATASISQCHDSEYI